MRSLSYAELEAVVEELGALSEGAGVQKVYARDERALVLRLRRSGQTRYLLVDATPGWTRLHYVDGKPAQPEQPAPFVMLLRKHVEGTGLEGVELAGDDRRVALRLLRREEEGMRRYELICELFGRRANVVLVRDGIVLGALDPRGGHLPGRPYVPPPGHAERGTDALGLGLLPVGQRSAVVENELGQLAAAAEQVRREAELGTLCAQEIKRVRRLVGNLERDLARAEDAQGARRRGELLQSAYRLEVPRGARSVRVPDYWTEGTPEVEVPLDPAKSLAENVARYFHEYRRMKDAVETITARLLGAMEELDELEGLQGRLGELGEDERATLLERLRSRGAARRRTVASRARGTGPLPPHRTFLARSGAQILVGRSARHNDALTLKVARGRDVWMHARDWAGSHVVLRMDRDGEPNGEDLRDAALLAAHFSKGRGDSLVDVTYTRAKHVRKPKGAPPGLVTIAGGSTIAVGPDDERLAQLFATEVLDA